MKKKFFLPIAILFFISNCATGPVHGILFNYTKFAGEFNTHTDVLPIKKAEGCSHQFLGLVAIGDNGAGITAKLNDIKKIAVIDHSSFSILTFVYRNYCTIIYGE